MLFKKKSARNNSTPERHRSTVSSYQRPSNVVFSYHASRSVRDANVGRALEEPQAFSGRPQPKFKWLRNTTNLVLVIFVLFLLVINFSLNNQPRIVVVSDTPGRIFLRDVTVYQKSAHALFASSLANSNKITINTSAIISSLKQQFPELEAASISLPVTGSQAVIYIQPATPQLILVEGSQGSFVLDSQGTALISTSQIQKNSKLNIPVVTDQANLRVHLGQLVLPSSNVAFIAQVAGQLAAKHLTVTSMTLPAGTPELDVRISGEPYYVKFNLRDDARAEVGTFLAVKEYLSNGNVTPSQYVDVRLLGRAYYK